MSRATRTAALVLVIAAAAWPWVGTLDHWPMAPDSATWIERSRLGAPDWFEWVFATRHFNVGWRPLAALSYTANHLAFGLEPAAYRAVDLALHAASVALLYAAFRRLFPARPAWAGLAAAALFAAHPVAEEVVPFIARRSYSLGTALGLAGLLLFARERRAGAGVLIALACFANEASVLFAGFLPFAAAARGESERRSVGAALRACALPLALVGAAVAVRLAVVGGLGGYRLPESAAERALPIFASTWRGVAGVPEGAPDALALALLLLAAPYYAFAALRGGPLRAGLAAWLVGYAVLYALQGVWFPRQAYVAVVPLALLFGDVLGARPRGLRLAPQLLLALAVLWSSPVVRGPDPARTAEWGARDTMITRMRDAFAACEEPATVHVALGYAPPREKPDALRARNAERGLPRLARQPVRWLRTLLEGRDLVLEELAYWELSSPAPRPAAADPLVLPAGVPAFVRAGGRMRELDPEEPRAVPLPAPAAGRATYVWIGDPAGGELLRR